MTRKKQIANKYETTIPERAALAAFHAAKSSKLQPAKIKIVNKKADIDHPDSNIGLTLLINSFGTTSFEFAHGILTQLCNIVSKGKEADPAEINFALAFVAGLQPRDEVEAMLAAQMAAIHTTTMTFARRLAHVETIPQQDSAERALNKLARTFAMQMEALKRYRTGGEQKVTVHHVTVNEGGQAIVGTVEQHKGLGEG